MEFENDANDQEEETLVPGLRQVGFTASPVNTLGLRVCLVPSLVHGINVLSVKSETVPLVLESCCNIDLDGSCSLILLLSRQSSGQEGVRDGTVSYKKSQIPRTSR